MTTPLNACITQTELSRIITEASKYTKANRPVLESLTHVLLASEGNTLTATCTNLTAGLQTSAECQGHSDGSVLVPAATLKELVAKFDKKSMLTLESKEGNRLSISTLGISVSVKGMDVRDLPPVTQTGLTSLLSINTAVFVDGVTKTASACAIEDNRPILMNIHLNWRKGLSMWGCDCFRAAMFTEINADMYNVSLSGMDNVSLPGRELGIFAAMLDKRAGKEVLIQRGHTGITLSAGTRVLSILAIHDGTYPDLSALVPESANTMVCVVNSELLRAIKMSQVLVKRDGYLSFLMGPRDGKLVLRSKSLDAGDAEILVAISGAGETMGFSVNPTYMIDILSCYALTDMVRLLLKEEEDIAVIRSDADPRLVHLVMPMRSHR